MKKLFYLFLAFQASNSFAQAPHQLDLSFNSTGWNEVTFTEDYALEEKGFLFQSDGKVLAYAQRLHPNEGSEAAIVRFNPNGTLDYTYGDSGIVLTKLQPAIDLYTESDAAVLQPDGKLLVAGPTFYAQTRIIRLTESGTLDPSFGAGSGYIDLPYEEHGYVNGIKLQSNGKIIIATKTNSNGSLYKVTRLNADGTVDNAFATAGSYVVNYPTGNGAADRHTLAITSDDKIIFSYQEYISNVNFNFHLHRLNSDGSNDDAFASNGDHVVNIDGLNHQFVFIPFRLDHLDRIYYMEPVYNGTSMSYSFSITRLAENGLEDSGFNAEHSLPAMNSNQTSFEFDLEVHGNFIYAMYASESFTTNLARFTIDNGLDPNFGVNGNLDASLLAVPPFVSNRMDIDPASGAIFISSNYSNGSGYKLLVVKITGSPVGVSVDDIKAYHNNFSIYPNPATSIVNLSTGVAEVSVVDPSGKVFLFKTGKTHQLIISGLPAGMYFVTASGFASRQLVITN